MEREFPRVYISDIDEKNYKEYKQDPEFHGGRPRDDLKMGEQEPDHQGSRQHFLRAQGNREDISDTE